MEPANRRPALGTGSVPLSTISTITGEQAAAGSRQPAPSGGGATYPAELAGPVAPFQPGACLATCWGLWAAGQMAPLQTPKWPTPALQQKSALTRRPFLFQVLVTPVPSCSSDLITQLKGEKLMVVPSTADGLRTAAIALRWWERRCEFSHLHAPRGPLCATSAEEPG